MELYSIEMKDVKSPAGSLRAERASVTRRRIADSARMLFATHGYGATTLREVALAAGVAVQTVYAVYGSKANILRALTAAVVDEPSADASFADALAAQDSADALALFARSIRLRWEAGYDIVVAGRDAASTDPAIRAELDRVLTRRRRGIAELARSLARSGGIGVEPAVAAAVIDALTLPEIYAELVVVNAWSEDAYEAWLTAALRCLILERTRMQDADAP